MKSYINQQRKEIIDTLKWDNTPINQKKIREVLSCLFQHRSEEIEKIKNFVLENFPEVKARREHAIKQYLDDPDGKKEIPNVSSETITLLEELIQLRELKKSMCNLLYSYSIYHTYDFYDCLSPFMGDRRIRRIGQGTT